MTCLIVEDEPLAQDVLAGYIADTSFTELIQVCGDAFSATEALQKHPVDLLFLDINLPRLSGIHFLKTLSHPPLVIFTTAYPEYAVEGFEMDAADYLLKPFSYERFLKAVNKALDLWKYRMVKQSKSPAVAPDMSGFILLRSEKKIYKVDYGDILYLESLGDYVKVHTIRKCLVVHETFRNLLEILPPETFIRVHRSFIIPIAKLTYIEGNRLSVSGTFIPIGHMYKEALLRRLNR